MNGESILTVTGAVVALTQLLKWAIIPDKYGPVSVLGLAALGVIFWGWSTGDVTRASSFGYFSGWVSVALSAAGVYGFTRAASTAVSNMKSPPAGGAGSSLTEKIPVFLLAAVLSSAAVFSACTPPPTIVTEPGRRAYSADQIAVRVIELQNATISAEADHLLPTPTARTIVNFCIDSADVLQTTPAGWMPTLQLSWLKVKAQIGEPASQAVRTAMAAIDLVLMTSGGGL